MQIIEFAPPKARVAIRGPVKENELVVRLPGRFAPWPPMTNLNILAAFAPYNGTWYDFGELLNIELDDNGGFWDKVGDRLDFGSKYKNCSTGLAQMLLSFRVWPFGKIQDNVHTPPGAFYHYLVIVKPGEETIGDYIITADVAEWYKFLHLLAYWRIRVKNKQSFPDDPKAWPWTHVSQIIRI